MTATDYMPPWTPDDTYRILSESACEDNEKATLSAWVAAGKPEGSRGQPRHPPSLKEVKRTPDMVLPMAEPYTHGGT